MRGDICALANISRIWPNSGRHPLCGRATGYVSQRTDSGTGGWNTRCMVCAILASDVAIVPVDAGPVDAYPIRQHWETDMNRDRVEGRLKQISGKLKEQWGKLTHDESGVDAGRRDQLAGSVQVRHAMSKEETERQVRDFLYRNRDWDLSRRWFQSQRIKQPVAK